jgi:hypothetical protein
VFFGQNFVKDSCAEFHENPTHALAAVSRSQIYGRKDGHNVGSFFVLLHKERLIMIISLYKSPGFVIVLRVVCDLSEVRTKVFI